MCASTALPALADDNTADMTPPAATQAAPEPVSVSPFATEIGNWETQFFSHQYSGETIDGRLRRIEQLVFGEVQSGSDSERIAKLNSSLNQPSDGPAVPAGVAEFVTTPPPPKPAISVTPVVNPAIPAVVASTASPGLSAGVNINQNPERPAELTVTKQTFATALKPDRIIHNLSEAIRDNPKDAELMYQRGKAFIQVDKLDRALSDLSDAIMFQPNRSDFYLARAWVYHLEGNGVLSDLDLKQAHFVDPQFPDKIDWGH